MAEAFRARVAHKRDTSSNWTIANPVLLNGEIIIVDTEAGEIRCKIGDGVKRYTQLPFDDEAVRSLVNSVHVQVNELNNIDYDASLAFDTSEIIIYDSGRTTSILGQAILGQMILA